MIAQKKYYMAALLLSSTIFYGMDGKKNGENSIDNSPLISPDNFFTEEQKKYFSPQSQSIIYSLYEITKLMRQNRADVVVQDSEGNFEVVRKNLPAVIKRQIKEQEKSPSIVVGENGKAIVALAQAKL